MKEIIIKNLKCLLLTLVLISCESRRDSCIEAAMNDGYDYESACEVCDDSSNEKMSMD